MFVSHSVSITTIASLQCENHKIVDMLTEIHDTMDDLTFIANSGLLQPQLSVTCNTEKWFSFVHGENLGMRLAMTI